MDGNVPGPTPLVRATAFEQGAEDAPFTAGWSVAAIAVHSVLQIPVPIVLRLLVPGREAIVIDFRHRAFSWSGSLRAFPDNPGEVGVETIVVAEDDEPAFDLPGRHLDILLWMLGLRSFENHAASWLHPGDRYHLLRWPNLSTMPHTIDHMRLVALLGNGWFCTDALAGAAGVGRGDAVRIINALSLMGVLESLPAEGPEQPVVVTPPARDGLLQRLRAKLGF